jgi:hypothetical protein
MDVTAEPAVPAQRLRHADELLHRVVRRADDAGGEEQPFDIVALVELHRERHHLFDGEFGPSDIRGAAVDAVGAIEQAIVREQDLQERDAAPVRRVGVADAGARGRAELARLRSALRRPRGRAGRIILCGVRQDPQLLRELLVHASPPSSRFVLARSCALPKAHGAAVSARNGRQCEFWAS